MKALIAANVEINLKLNSGPFLASLDYVTVPHVLLLPAAVDFHEIGEILISAEHVSLLQVVLGTRVCSTHVQVRSATVTVND